jgi:P27 family predicted phage terminase small subunit
MTTRRKPKPLLFTGTNRNRREPLPFDPPFHLDGIALQEWQRILGSCYWLKESEAFAIADRCLCVARLLECELDIQTRGHVIRTRNGKVQNPSVRIARSYRISIQRHDDALGLTASSRGRLVEGEPTYPGGIDPIERALCGD